MIQRPQIILSRMRLFYAFGRSTRLPGSLGAGAIIWLLTHDVAYAGVAVLFCLFSYLFNDACDHKKDKVAHPARPLPLGLMSQQIALGGSASLFVLGLLTALVLRPGLFKFFLALFAASFLYSIGLKRWVPAVATPWWCLLGTTLFLMPIQPDLWQFTCVFSFFFARELLLDYRDRFADQQFCRTAALPALLGRHTFTVVYALQLWSVIAAFVLGNAIVLIGNVIVSLMLLRLMWGALRGWGRDADLGAEPRDVEVARRVMWVGFVLAAAL